MLQILADLQSAHGVSVIGNQLRNEGICFAVTRALLSVSHTPPAAAHIIWYSHPLIYQAPIYLVPRFTKPHSFPSKFYRKFVLNIFWQKGHIVW